MKEYGCGGLMLDGGRCSSTGDTVCLCDMCQQKLIEQLEAAQQSMHTDPPSALRPQSSTGKLSSPMVEIISQDLAGG